MRWFASRRAPFDQAGIFILLLMLVIWFGFGPSYFFKIFKGVTFTAYFHLHAIFMVLWVMILLAQPVLIRRKKFGLHKSVGKFSYLLFPIMIITTMLLIHSQLSGSTDEGSSFFIPFKDVIVLVVYYSLGIGFKRNVQLHSRLMIATIIPLIEPSLVRAFFNLLPDPIVSHSYYLTIAIIDLVIVFLIIRDLKFPKLRWVFVSLLGLIILFQTAIITGAADAKWMNQIARRFSELPLTVK